MEGFREVCRCGIAENLPQKGVTSANDHDQKELGKMSKPIQEVTKLSAELADPDQGCTGIR